MHALDVSSMPDRLELGAAVRSRSWEWLFALRKRLNVDLQLVDEAQVPVLSAPAEPGPGKSGHFGDAPGVRLAVSNAIRTRTPQAASVDRQQTVVVPVTLDRMVSGALLVTRRTREDQPTERVRSELELVAFWLTTSIEAHLQSPPVGQDDLERLSVMGRLLSDASTRGSDRDLVSAFVEMLSVWHDLDGYGYVEDRNEFTRDVALPGADLARTPAVIARAALPDLDDVVRLARSDIDRLGFAAGEDVAFAHVGEGPGSWLIAITGAGDFDELPRLSLYVSLLDQAVARATEAATARVLAAVSTSLLGDAATPREQAGQALRHLQSVLGMTSASLTVTSRTGAPLLHIGGSFTAADLEAGSGGGKVVILRRDPQRYAMALVADWSSGHRVTHQENHVVQAVGNVLESWVRQLVQQTPGTGDRRAGTRGFDDVLERCARDAVQDGAPVTVLVISFRDVMMRSEQTQTHVSRLREYLRGGDLVGRLNDGDVGVLLHDTDAAQADVPVGRLQQLLARDGIPAAAVSIGMATRVPGDPITGGLAHEARQRAHDARVNQP